MGHVSVRGELLLPQQGIKRFPCVSCLPVSQLSVLLGALLALGSPPVQWPELYSWAQSKDRLCNSSIQHDSRYSCSHLMGKVPDKLNCSQAFGKPVPFRRAPARQRLSRAGDATRIGCVHRRAGPDYTRQEGQSKYLKIGWFEATEHSCAHVNKSAVDLIWHVLFWASWQCITLIKSWGISTRMLFGMYCSNTSISYSYHLLRCNFGWFIMTITKNGVFI